MVNALQFIEAASSCQRAVGRPSVFQRVCPSFKWQTADWAQAFKRGCWLLMRSAGIQRQARKHSVSTGRWFLFLFRLLWVNCFFLFSGLFVYTHFLPSFLYLLFLCYHARAHILSSTAARGWAGVFSRGFQGINVVGMHRYQVIFTSKAAMGTFRKGKGAVFCASLSRFIQLFVFPFFIIYFFFFDSSRTIDMFTLMYPASWSRWINVNISKLMLSISGSKCYQSINPCH